MEDVYFERIAGVGAHEGETPRQPRGATKVQQREPPVLNMVLDDDPSVVEHDMDMDMVEAPVAQEEVECDENGFPVSPLRDQEDLWFVQAADLYKPLAKAVNTARASGMLLLVGGVLTVVIGALGVDMVALVIGLIVATLGAMERSAANDLAQAKASAPSRLALNQMFVLVLVIASSWMTVRSIDTEAAKAMAISDEAVAELPVEAQEIARMMHGVTSSIAQGMFIAVVAVSVLFQGGFAVYYLTRRRKIREFHEELPPWVSEIVTTVALR